VIDTEGLNKARFHNLDVQYVEMNCLGLNNEKILIAEEEKEDS
jgi:hypothetical protein